MASASRNLVIALACAATSPLRAQSPAPLRLSFADAVRQATGQSRAVPPSVAIAGFRADEATARVRQTRSGLLPNLSLSGSWLSRTFNTQAQGLSFPGIPKIIGPFDAYDGRVRVTQTLFDFATLGRVSAAKSQASAAGADRSAVIEASAQNVALAYTRATRAQAVVNARQADSALAAELVNLAVAQQQAGVSASIDVTRARTQLAEAAGRLIVASNQRDRARIDLARALGIDPDTPITLTDRTAASAIAAERLPRLELEADYGLSGVALASALSTRQVAVQVTLPILDGFRREGRLAEQQAVVRESDVRARDLREQVSADVDGALLDLRSAVAQQMIATDRLQLAAQEVSEARQRFKAGVAGNIEVINAQSSLLRARDADIDARFAAVTARIALARSVGSARTLH